MNAPVSAERARLRGAASAYRPNVIRLGWERTAIELKQFFRNPQLLFFTFSLPILLLVVFGMIFSWRINGPPGTTPIRFRQYFVAGMIAAGIVSTTFTSLAITISIERHEGLLKRLAGTPLPKTAYFAGKIGLALVSSAIQTLLMLVIGAAFFKLTIPTDPTRWLVFSWVFLLGVASCSLLGIAYTRLIPNASSAAAIVQAPYLLLQFISGVFFVFTELPPVLRDIAVIFPLKWMAQGFRYVFLPDWFAVKEQGGQWNLPLIAFVLAAWTIGGLVIAGRAFRWSNEADR